MIDVGWPRTVRRLISLAAGVRVLATVAAGMASTERQYADAFEIPPSYLETAVFTVVMTGLTLGAFALYAWRVRGPSSSVVIGLLMLVPTAWVFVYSAVETIAGRARGAGGP